MDEPNRTEYLFENFRTTREEILFRAKHRDNWLKLQLLAQVVLLGLTLGVEIAGAKAGQPHPEVLFLTFPVSFILASCYHIEDNLIGFLSNYIRSISTAEMILRKSGVKILNWDLSLQLQQYISRTLPTRLLAQLTTFIVIPLCLTIFRFTYGMPQGILGIIEISIDLIFFLWIVILSIKSYRIRRSGIQAPIPSILTPPNDLLQNLLSDTISNKSIDHKIGR